MDWFGEGNGYYFPTRNGRHILQADLDAAVGAACDIIATRTPDAVAIFSRRLGTFVAIVTSDANGRRVWPLEDFGACETADGSVVRLPHGWRIGKAGDL